MSKVLLRPWKREDAFALASIANNRNIFNNVRDSFPSPYTVTDAIQWIDKEKNANPGTNFAVLYEEEIAGSIGIILNEDVYRNTIEIGYFIAEQFWGRGIATEAIHILCGHIQQEFRGARIMARVFEYNKASMKVLLKNNFFLEGIQRRAAIKNKQILDVYLWVKLP